MFVGIGDGGTWDFTVTLDASGPYHVNLASGVQDEGVGTQTISVFDGSTLLWTITGTPGQATFMDATGKIWPSANMWNTLQLAHAATFAGTSCRVHVVGSTARGSLDSLLLSPVVPATKLGLSTTQDGIRTGAVFRTQPVVQTLDALNRVVFTDTSTVTATLNILTGVGTLAGTTTVACVAGVATFTNLQITGQSGTATITYTDGSLTAVTSAPFTFGPATTATITTT
jgi:hypothetical protein